MKFALAGNPNSGKTTLFNTLTGSTAHVGNWPGVTVERKEGVYKKLDQPINIIDLPGIYSLSPYTPEEVVARNYLFEGEPDLVINIVDVTNLERNLYLTTQLLEMDCPVIVALNMMDIAAKENIVVDAKILEQKLGVPVMGISALKTEGIENLMRKAVETAKNKRKGKTLIDVDYLKGPIKQIEKLIEGEGLKGSAFHAIKLIEGDELEEKNLSNLLPEVNKIKKTIAIPEGFDDDFEAVVAGARYDYIASHLGKAFKKGKERGHLTTSDKIDKVLTNKWVGIPIFLFFMFLVFHITFSENFLFLTKFAGLEEGIPSLGIWLLGLTETFIEWLSGVVQNGLVAVNASGWIVGLVVDGILGGVGAVLSFIPQILLLFLFLSIMEDSGYMARVAFLMDRVLRRFGLSGKAFMPLLMGFGCSVPAILSTRTLESQQERRLTIFLMPFFSCGAKLPIWGMIAATFFPHNADLVVFSIYVLGIVVAVLAAIFLKKTFIKGEASVFIMEMPAYHLPRLKNIFPLLWDKFKMYLYRAATIIAASTVVIWFLSNFTFTLQMVDANSANSIMGVLGNFLRPIFVPLGFASGPQGWKMVVAIITGLIAKEMVVSTMGVLYAPGVEGDAAEDDTAATALGAAVAGLISPLAAFSFMVFNLLTVPCMAAVASARTELGKGKWTWGAIAFWLATSWIFSFLVFNIGKLLGLG